MRFVIYGRESCPVCDRALKFMEMKALTGIVEYVDLDTNVGALEGIQADGFSTIPAIYYAEGDADNWTVIGGFTELQKFVKEKGL